MSLLSRHFDCCCAVCALIITCLLAFGGYDGVANADIAGPYVADGETLHLWHFDQTSGTTAPDAVPNSPVTLTALYGATIGTTSFAGFGEALSVVGPVNGSSG